MLKIYFTSMLVFAITFSFSQELFLLDFEKGKTPQGWETTNKSEWAHVLGEDGSSYFRFHPSFLVDRLESEPMNLEAGNYVIYFSWSETGVINPDFVNVRIKKNNGNWEEIGDFGGLEGGGSNRLWLKDSLVIGNLDAADYIIQFQYKGLGKYPAQYINLDNISLVKNDLVTSVPNFLEQVEFAIFPNPTAEQLTFTISDPASRNFTGKILSANGQLMKTINQLNSNGENSIDVSNFSKGIYLLELVNEEGVKTESFVVQ